MPKIKTYDIYAFNELFNQKIRHALGSMIDYRNELLKNCEKSTNTSVDFDTEFMLDMAEKGFVSCVKIIYKASNESLEADKDIQKQIDEILKYPFED